MHCLVLELQLHQRYQTIYSNSFQISSNIYHLCELLLAVPMLRPSNMGHLHIEIDCPPRLSTAVSYDLFAIN